MTIVEFAHAHPWWTLVYSIIASGTTIAVAAHLSDGWSQRAVAKVLREMVRK